jgi:hypothetical protein
MKPAAVTTIVAVLVAIPMMFLTRRVLPVLLRSRAESREDMQNRLYDTEDCMM